MAYVPQTAQLGIPPIASTLPLSLAAGKSVPAKLGDIIKAVDPVYGVGEFIYLLGVAATVVGSLVTWGGNASGTPTYQTALASAGGNKAQSLAVAMSANVANQYGWYQISGNAVVATNGTLAAGPAAVYVSATAGQVTSTQAAGAQIENAVNVTATGTPAANQAVVQIDRPFAQGQIV